MLPAPPITNARRPLPSPLDATVSCSCTVSEPRINAITRSSPSAGAGRARQRPRRARCTTSFSWRKSRVGIAECALGMADLDRGRLALGDEREDLLVDRAELAAQLVEILAWICHARILRRRASDHDLGDQVRLDHDVLERRPRRAALRDRPRGSRRRTARGSRPGIHATRTRAAASRRAAPNPRSRRARRACTTRSISRTTLRRALRGSS